MLCSASNQISSPKRMTPQSGRSKPAKHRNVVDFPEPEGPNRTVKENVAMGRRNFTRIAGFPPKCFSKSANNTVPEVSSLSATNQLLLPEASDSCLLAGKRLTRSLSTTSSSGGAHLRSSLLVMRGNTLLL